MNSSFNRRLTTQINKHNIEDNTMQIYIMQHTMENHFKEIIMEINNGKEQKDRGFKA